MVLWHIKIRTCFTKRRLRSACGSLGINTTNGAAIYIYIYIRQSIDWHHPWPDRSSYTSPRQVVSGLTQIINDPPNDPNLRVHSLCDCHGTCTRPACDVSGFGGEKVMQSAEHHGWTFQEKQRWLIRCRFDVTNELSHFIFPESEDRLSSFLSLAKNTWIDMLLIWCAL